MILSIKVQIIFLLLKISYLKKIKINLNFIIALLLYKYLLIIF